MPEPTELRVRMLAMLSGLTRETTLYANEEYVLPRATAERYFDHGIAEIVDPNWEQRPARGNDEQQALARSHGEQAVERDETETRAEPEPAPPSPRGGRAKKETSP